MHKKELAEQIKSGKWDLLLRGETVNRLRVTSQEGIEEIIDEITDVPINFARDISGEMFKLYFIAEWIDAFERTKLAKNPSVLEIASGASDPIPQALEIYSDGEGSYVSANLNRILTEGLRRRTASLRIEVRVVEDNAVNLEKYIEPEAFDVVTFQHAINDVFQTIIADRKGIDTVNNDWFDILPAMIQGVTEYYRQGKLREVAYDNFIDLIGVCWRLLKRGGYMIFNTHVYQIDLDCGYPLELYGSYVPLARDWIATSDLGLEIIDCDGFDPQWWLFVRKP